MFCSLPLLLALLGTALLSGLIGWLLRSNKIKELVTANEELISKSNRQKLAYDRISGEQDALQISLNNYKGISSDLESANLKLANELKTMQGKQAEYELKLATPLIKEVEVVKEVEKIIEKIVPVETIKEVEVIKEVPVEVVKEVEKIVTKEMPVEVIKEIEVIKEVPVEVIKEIEVIKEVYKEVPSKKPNSILGKNGIMKKPVLPKKKKEAGPVLSSIFRTYLRQDNLKVIEGVGKKIEQILKNNDISNLKQLANSTPEKLKGILQSGGASYKIHNPKTWPEQAKLAVEGNWGKLIEYQKFLDSGRDNTGDFDTPSKVEVLLNRISTSPYFLRNLQIVEGIGPQIEKLLNKNGIKTLKGIATESPEKLKEVLLSGGNRYKIHNPKTWPDQAKLAVEGDWGKLIEYQKFLDSGREDKGDFETPAKVEKLLVKFSTSNGFADDLKLVEGIGPKIEQLLFNAGIYTWEKLSNTTPMDLGKILNEAGPRFQMHSPETWPKQARLIVEGKWSTLEKLQDDLVGGRVR